MGIINGMTEFKAVLREDRDLAVGQPATVFWTNSGDHFRGDGVVSKVNDGTA